MAITLGTRHRGPVNTPEARIRLAEAAQAAAEQMAAEQDGVITRQQARQSGMTDGMIRARMRQRRWQRIWPATYATFTGPVPPRSARWAAVLYCGSSAMLSHETAAELWGFAEQRSGVIHVTIPATSRVRAQPGLMVHRSARTSQARHPGRHPPVTRVEETAVDLTQTAAHLGQAIAWLTAVCQHRLTTPERLLPIIRDRSRTRWRAELISALQDVLTGCHSILERHYLRMVEQAHGLPTPRRQARTTPHRRSQYDDVRYDQWRLVVELDGRVGHSGSGRDRDRQRDNRTVADGLAVLRYGWRDVVDRPCQVAAQVGAVLRRQGWLGHPRRCSPTCPIEPTGPIEPT